MGRVFVHEPVLSSDNALHVLDYERASEVIRTATHRGIGVCYCRHKMEHVDRACAAPMDICMTFNGSAESLTRHGFARPVDVAEGLDLLQQAYEHNLVQFGENVRQGVNFICNCCGCCCEAMIAARRFGAAASRPHHQLPPADRACGLHRLRQVRQRVSGGGDDAGVGQRSAPAQPKAGQGGRGTLPGLRRLCAGLHPARHHPALAPQRVITPVNSTHRVVVMAVERGKLQNLIFDNQVLWSHRALAAVLGVILKLPPLKQAMASQQMKSRYLEALISRLSV